MKVIRANRGIFIPQNPENPDMNSMRLVQTGLIAIVPDGFALPKDSFSDVGEFQYTSKKPGPKKKQQVTSSDPEVPTLELGSSEN